MTWPGDFGSPCSIMTRTTTVTQPDSQAGVRRMEGEGGRQYLGDGRGWHRVDRGEMPGLSSKL